MKCPADLTARQWQCVLAIRSLTAELGLPPSLTEVSKRMGIVGAGAVTHTMRLRELGYLMPAPHGQARSLVLSLKARKSL